MMLPGTVTLKWEPYPGDLTSHEPLKGEFFFSKKRKPEKLMTTG